MGNSLTFLNEKNVSQQVHIIIILQILQQIRLTLLEQQPTESVSGEEALKLMFKLPDGSKVDGMFKKNSKPKVFNCVCVKLHGYS